MATVGFWIENSEIVQKGTAKLNILKHVIQFNIYTKSIRLRFKEQIYSSIRVLSKIFKL